MTGRARFPQLPLARDHRADATVPSRQRDTGSSYYMSPYRSPSESKSDAIAEIEIETAALSRVRERQTERFLRGPIPLCDIATAARLPGHALAVLLAIHHRQALTKSPVVTLPRRLLEELGVTKDSKARALRALEAVGLVRVDRKAGRSPRISFNTERRSR